MEYIIQHLKYHTQIHVKSRHGKNKGRKISGVEPLPGEDKVSSSSLCARFSQGQYNVGFVCFFCCSFFFVCFLLVVTCDLK